MYNIVARFWYHCTEIVDKRWKQARGPSTPESPNHAFFHDYNIKINYYY